MKNPRTDQFTATAGFENQRQVDNTSKKYLLSGSISRLDNGWQKSLFITIEQDKDFIVGGQTGNSTLVMPGINWTRVHADNRIYTTFGNRFMVEVRGGSETLGSTTSFVQTRANVKFVRRLQNIIHFPMPRSEERYELWRKTFPQQITLSDDIDWRQIASRHELSGAGILNVTQFCAVDMLAKSVLRLDLKSLETAIQREYVKEGKIL